MTCPDCERHKLSASMWRNKAYEAGGTPLPWAPEELLRKEYERGRADGAAAERAEVERLKLLCEEMLRELYVYRASEYLKDVTANIRARGNA